MNDRFLARWAACASVLLWLAAGCGGYQPARQRAVPDAHRDRSPSWMAPDAVSHARLLYVTDQVDGDVYALSLPSGKLVGKLTGFNQPVGDCVDAHGDVFITEAQSHDIRVFKHGAREPYEVLSDTGYYPLGCSIDPTTGNLAVSNEIGDGNGSDPGDVAIYKKAKGTPDHFADAAIYQYGWCAYDNSGNLFVDGTSVPPSDAPQFAELPKASRKFQNISFNVDLSSYDWVQWDGQYLAVGSGSATIYEFSISGDTGTEVGSTPLAGEATLLGFWIDSIRGNRRVYAAVFQNESQGEVGVYRYPAGGKARGRFYGVVDPWALVLSERPE